MEFFNSPYYSETLDDSTGSFLENYIELDITCTAGATIIVNRYESDIIVDTINVGVVASGNCIVNLPCFGKWEVVQQISGATNSEIIFILEVKKYFVDVLV